MGRAVARMRATGCGGGRARTTAAVIPRLAARPGRPATALTFGPQAAERCREAEPHSRHAAGVSPCGTHCRRDCRSAAGRRLQPRFQEGLPQGTGEKIRLSGLFRLTRTTRPCSSALAPARLKAAAQRRRGPRFAPWNATRRSTPVSRPALRPSGRRCRRRTSGVCQARTVFLFPRGASTGRAGHASSPARCLRSVLKLLQRQVGAGVS